MAVDWLAVKIFIHIFLAAVFAIFSLTILANILIDYKRKKPYIVIMMFLCLSDTIGGINLVSLAALDETTLRARVFCSTTVLISRWTILATGALVTLMAAERMLGLEFCFWYDNHVTVARTLVVTVSTLIFTLATASLTFVGESYYSRPPSPGMTANATGSDVPATTPSMPTRTSTLQMPESGTSWSPSWNNATNATSGDFMAELLFCRSFPHWPQAGPDAIFMHVFAAVDNIFLLLSLGFNFVTLRGLWRMRVRVAALVPSSATIEENSVRRLILVLSLAFVVTTIPSCIYAVQIALDGQPAQWFRALAMFLITSTYLLDPLIYLALTPRYRRRTWNFIRVKVCRRLPVDVSPVGGQTTAFSHSLNAFSSSRGHVSTTDVPEEPLERPATPLPECSPRGANLGLDCSSLSAETGEAPLPYMVRQNAASQNIKWQRFSR